MGTHSESSSPAPPRTVRSFTFAKQAANAATRAAPARGSRPAATQNRLVGLEGIRGFGCLSIVFLHCAAHFTPNILATTRIDIFGQWLTYFFVLSGFLLYLPYAKRFMSGKDIPNAGTYLQHRVRRVFPAYFVIFIVANFVLQAVYVQNPVEAISNNEKGAFGGMPGTGMITNPLDLLAQFTLTQSLFPETLQTGINPAWSLTTEWGFYLILPLIGYVLFRFARGTDRPLLAAALPAAVLFVLGLSVNTFVRVWQHASGLSGLEAYWGPTWPAVLSRSFLSLADTFAFGMLAAVLYLAFAQGLAAKLRTLTVQWILAAIVLVMCGVTVVVFVMIPHYIHTAFAPAAAASILLITFAGTRGEHSTVASITDWRPMKYVGIMSLSVYLWHYPVLIVVERFLNFPPTYPGLLGSSLIVGSISVAFAAVSYKFVEAPAMRADWSPRRRARSEKK